MAEITIIDDDDDCEGERGERGERGHRGHRGPRGHEGPEGPTGPTGSSGPSGEGVLKFSGTITGGQPTGTNYLADGGIGLGEILGEALNYPIPETRTFRTFATNVLDTLPMGGSLVINVLRNGIPVASIPYGGVNPSSGIQIVSFGPVTFAAGDTLDVQVVTAGFAFEVIDITAMLT